MSDAADGFDTVLGRTVGKRPPAAEEAHERFFGFVTGVQDRAHNVEFRKAEGAWPFREYSYLLGGEAVHAGEFVLRYATGERVTVRGRNLRPLYEKLLRHRITWVREAASGETAPDEELFVDEIEGPVKDEDQDGAVGP